MRPRIVIIGANDFQNQLILKAQDMGYETHVFAWECGDVGEKTADFFYPISIIEKERILEECIKIQPDGIVSIASDLANITVNYVAEKLGLCGNGSKVTYWSTNKYKMRQIFESAKLPSPKYRIADKTVDLHIHDFRFPVIVKPTDRSGSRGICKVDNINNIFPAINHAMSESFEKKVLIEEYIDGKEFSVEYVSFRGKHHFLNITEKFTTGAPNFIETGHFEPAMISDDSVKKVKIIIERALDTLEIADGASHSEIKIDSQGNIKIIEIGSRMGGDCIGSDLVYLSTGMDYLAMVIDIACGKHPDFKPKRTPLYAGIKFIFTKHDMEKLEWIRKQCPQNIYRVSQIDNVENHLITDSSNRCGYFIFTAEEKNEFAYLAKYILA